MGNTSSTRLKGRKGSKTNAKREIKDQTQMASLQEFEQPDIPEVRRTKTKNTSTFKLGLSLGRRKHKQRARLDIPQESAFVHTSNQNNNDGEYMPLDMTKLTIEEPEQNITKHVVPGDIKNIKDESNKSVRPPLPTHGTFPLNRQRLPRNPAANVFKTEETPTHSLKPAKSVSSRDAHQPIHHVDMREDLANRLQTHPLRTSVPFFIKNRPSSNTICSYECVPLPFQIDQTKDNNEINIWPVITKKLFAIDALCKHGHSPMDIVYDAVSAYCPTALDQSNFHMLDRPDHTSILVKTLPIISEMALKLPKLLQEQIPILVTGQSKTVFLTRELCCSLLANAFFCTFPSHQLRRMPDFNFFNLYNDTSSARCEIKKEKLKCILNYFLQINAATSNLEFLRQIISFERRCILKKTKWGKVEKLLCDVKVKEKTNIEQTENMLQVDFANKIVGGGVLNDGSVMEEIRFSISPELIVSRLFTQTLNDDEVLCVTGAEIYSQYRGYSTSFQYCGPTLIDRENQPVDNFGRTFTQIVAMDALHFKRNAPLEQFQKRQIDRELHKCRVAFQVGKYNASPVATGNWGCGAFNGNKELKFIIQWMAASKMKRPMMQYHTSGDKAQGQACEDIYFYIKHRNISVGQLYHVITHYATDNQANQYTSLFDYVKCAVEDNNNNNNCNE